MRQRLGGARHRSDSPATGQDTAQHQETPAKRSPPRNHWGHACSSVPALPHVPGAGTSRPPDGESRAGSP